MIKFVKSTLLFLSGVLVMGSCSTDWTLDDSEKMTVRFTSDKNGEVDRVGSKTADKGSILYSVATAVEGYELAGWFN
ncbi:MAG: hypothetical protein ACRCZZ_01350, partial [Phocaeicola sp.]